MRPDLVELMQYAKNAGMRVVISTNGTLITPQLAKRFADVGLSYVGVSFDGDRETHDCFRGVQGSYDAALRGLHNAQDAGIKRVCASLSTSTTGARSATSSTDGARAYQSRMLLPPGVRRSRIVDGGRGFDARADAAGVRLIMDRTRDWFDRGGTPEILTVDNHADGPFVYLELLKEDPERAAKVMQLLQWNQGNSSGNGIGCISWDGEVYADQFWRHFSFGNVKDRPFSEIWSDVSRTTPESELMFRLKTSVPG